jgi:hypothetical protein
MLINARRQARGICLALTGVWPEGNGSRQWKTKKRTRPPLAGGLPDL